MINTSNCFDNNFHVFVTLKILLIFAGTLFIRESKYTTVVLQRHLNANNKRAEYFGVEKERRDRLERVKGTLKDFFKLSIATILIMVILTMTGIIKTVLS